MLENLLSLTKFLVDHYLS
ncbi:UNVERIFIED_CONTAM: hypothetical protein GTU68_061551 [Idotea baltica]|nr:hypothetical protein [Idotea baltica]